MTRELPVVDVTRCICSGDCVAICPTDCLAMSEDAPWLDRPALCISCAACVFVCPVDAIDMRPMPKA